MRVELPEVLVYVVYDEDRIAYQYDQKNINKEGINPTVEIVPSQMLAIDHATNN